MTQRSAGFTLVEMLIALAMGSLILAGAGVAFQLGAQTLRGGADQADAQQNARWALERMVQEIRGAGYDPTSSPPTYTFDAVTFNVATAATNLTLQNDFNGNGALDAAGACDASAIKERVAYYLAGTDLRRSTDAPANTCEATIVGGVTNLAFGYLDADGNATTTPSLVRTVTVAVTVVSQTGGAGRRVAVQDRVRLRNR
jgi:type IV pilus assembly protein PilW